MIGLLSSLRLWFLNANVFMMHLLIYSYLSKSSISISQQQEDSIRNSQSTYLELDALSFDAAINQYELLLINFYAPWCGHCQQAEKNLKVAAARLSVKQSKAKIAFLDATAETNAALIQDIGGIDGYPTMAVYKHGQRIADYNGGRKPKDIIDYLESKINPLVQRVDTLNELHGYLHRISPQGLLSDTGVLSVIFGFFSEQDVHDDENEHVPTPFQLFESAAVKLDMSTFIYSHNPDLFRAYYLPPVSSSKHTINKDSTTATITTTANTLLVFAENSITQPHQHQQHLSEENSQHFKENSFSNAVLTGTIPLYTHNTTEDYIIKSILRLSQPAIITYSKQMHAFLQYLPVKKHVLIFYQADDHIPTQSATAESSDTISTAISTSNYILKVIEEIASNYRGDLIFLLIDSHQYALMQFFEIDSTMLPQIVIADMSNAANMKRFVYDTFLNYHNESSIRALINKDNIYDGNDNSGKATSGDSSKIGSNNNYDSLYIDVVIRAFSHSSNDMGTTAAQSRLPPATARRVLNDHQANSNNQNSVPNSKNMKIQDKYSIALLTLYFNSYLANMILPTLRSEPFESTASTATLTASTTTTTASTAMSTDGSVTNNDISSSTSSTTNATPIAVPSTANALMNAAQRGIVNKLTGSTFYDMVMQDENIDFFIFFVAPWCGHCKQIEPTIADVAHYYKSDRSMRIGRLDGTKNDINHDAVHVRSYPAFYIFLSTEKSQPIEYDGERSVKAMTQFIADERSKYRKRHRKNVI